MRLLTLILTLLPVLQAGNIFPVTVPVPGGCFRMGSERGGEDADEAPMRTVTVDAFAMGVTEVTNLQYEQFDPSHRALRGAWGFSSRDDEAVVLVSWYDAVAYCEWLSERTGRHYRLPTEAEWEYACRAGTTTDYWTGDTLAAFMQRHQRTERNKVPVPLTVGLGEPNPFGLYDMHGNVEEWCLDRYGEFRVTRGGSHNTPLRYLRSANRSAMIPADRNVQVGFRVVEASPVAEPAAEAPQWAAVQPVSWAPCPAEAFFAEPLPFVIPPVDEGVPFYRHNHQPAIAACPDGTLLAIWFSCNEESGREMVVLQSRFHPETGAWEPATLFYKVPDRNMTGSALLTLADGRMLHFNGVADSGDWQNLALVLRESLDAGYHWSPSRIVEADHQVRRQVIAGPIVTRDGRILLCCDAGADGEAGTALHVSRDGGISWEDTGSRIAGIHAGIVERADGSLMAFGRGNSITGADGKPHMPMSISYDGGFSWEYTATVFPPIGSGQRLVLKRLAEGPILLASFGPQGLFTSLSYDEGAHWSTPKLLSDGQRRELDGGAWTGRFVLDAEHAEPKGYLACTQSPDGVIHLLSSCLHYRFNLAWLER